MNEQMKEWWMYPHFSLAVFNNPLFENRQKRSAKKLKHQIERRIKEKLARKANRLRRRKERKYE